MPSYKILSTDNGDTKVTLTLTDGSTSNQTLADVPLKDQDACNQFFTDYIAAYEQGLAKVATPPSVVPVNQTITL